MSEAVTTHDARALAPARMVWMDVVRGLAIVLVVAFHARTVLRRFVPEVPEQLGTAIALFAPFRMPLLMFLSGMLLGRSLAKPLRAYVVGKARGIAWPYAVWSVLFLLVASRATPEGLLRILWDAPPHLWYLHYLLAYYAIARVLRAAGVPLGAAALVAFAASFIVDGQGRRFTLMLVFFLAGEVLTRHRARLPRPRPAYALAVGVVAAVAAVASAAGVDLKYEPRWVAAPAAGIALCLLVAPGRTTSGPVARALAHVGRESLTYYVSHFVVLWAFYRALHAAGADSALPLYVAGTALSFAAGAALVWGRPRSRLVRALFAPPARPVRAPVPGVRRRL